MSPLLSHLSCFKYFDTSLPWSFLILVFGRRSAVLSLYLLLSLEDLSL